MMLVTAAAGRTGSSAVAALVRHGAPVRAMVRAASRAAVLPANGVDVVVGDFEDAGRLRELCRGIEVLVLISPNGPRQHAIETTAIDIAVAAGVRRIVKLSSMEAVPDAPNPVHASHFAIEQHLRASGREWTIVRTSFFMQNLLGPAKRIASEGVLSLPVGEGKAAMTDAADAGECLGCVALSDAHASQSYDVTGPDLLSFAQVAERLGRHLGKDVRYEPENPAAYRERLSRIIPSAWHVDAVCGIFAEIRSGYFVEPTAQFATLCGHPPASLEVFAGRHAASFGAPA